jgi:hypothetical protein
VVVAYDFLAGRVERGPTRVLGEAERVEDGGDIAMWVLALRMWEARCRLKSRGPGCDHPQDFGEIADLPSDTGVPIDPPCSSDACLAIEYTKLIKTKLLF